MRCKRIFILIFCIFLSGLASAASFTLSENGSSITTQYESNGTLKADLNISFLGESLNSTFSDSRGNSIQLGELLSRDTNYDYILYDLTNTTISSAFQTLRLEEANFNLPTTTGSIAYTLSFKGSILFSKTFQIMSAKNLIDETLEDKYSQLNASKVEIAKYSLSVQKMLNEFLNITSIENNLKKIEIQYVNSVTSEENTQILNNLSAIKIPHSISKTISTDSISFYPSRENINLDVLVDIGGGSYGDNEEEYKNATYFWNDKNLKTDLTFTEMSIVYASGEQTTLKVFEFNFDKSGLTKDAYFIVQDLGDIEFEDVLASQIQESSSGYLYININNAPNNIIFSTTGDFGFLDVPAFISPSLNDLNIVEVEDYPRWIDNKKSRWILFAIIIFIILLIGFVTYMLLQNWYRKRYETYLFKNRNNLFNIMTYIQNAKKKNMPRNEILNNLKKAGWTGEQINYAIRKYEDKKIIGLIQKPLNITAETEKKIEPTNSKPLYKTFNMDPGAVKNPEKKPGQDTNTKV